MTCLGCNFVEMKPVMLADGRTVCSNCEDYRNECEIRSIAQMPSNAERATFLALVRKSRGDAIADQLRADVWEWMKK